jgi:hypothetical protein
VISLNHQKYGRNVFSTDSGFYFHHKKLLPSNKKPFFFGVLRFAKNSSINNRINDKSFFYVSNFLFFLKLYFFSRKLKNTSMILEQIFILFFLSRGLKKNKIKNKKQEIYFFYLHFS